MEEFRNCFEACYSVDEAIEAAFGSVGPMVDNHLRGTWAWWEMELNDAIEGGDIDLPVELLVAEYVSYRYGSR